MSGSPNRGPYQGVLHVLEFNASNYLAAVGGLLAAALVWPLLTPLGRVWLLLGVTPVLFWTASSLIVSHYVYDRFPVYDFRPIARLLTRAPARWINVHSGWDETSERLRDIFPGASGQVVDIFDAHQMTESSIRKARRINEDRIPATEGCYNALPFGTACFDAAFSIFAAHELRRHEQRVDLFREIARILTPDGEFVLMEHVRDWRNFLAFGPGFLHFYSERAWQNTAQEAGLNLHRKLSVTPFVRVYFLRKNR